MAGEPARDVAVDQNRRPCLKDDATEPANRLWQVRVPDAALDRVGIADRAGVEVIDPDVDDLGVEDLLDLVPDEVVHRLDVELLR